MKITLKNKVKKIIDVLNTKYPSPKCALEHTSPWQLLVATILSATHTIQASRQRGSFEIVSGNMCDSMIFSSRGVKLNSFDALRKAKCGCVKPCILKILVSFGKSCQS